MQTRLGFKKLTFFCVAIFLATPIMAAAPVFVATTGSDAPTAACPSKVLGTTPECPVASIAKGMTLASPGSDVRVTVGAYTGKVELRTGVTIAGGYSADFSKITTLSKAELESAARTAKEYPGHTRLSAGTGEDRVLVGRGLKSGTTVRNMVVFGPDLTGKTGRSSYVIVVQDSESLQLDNVKLVAGKGETGAPGEAGNHATAWCTNSGAGGQTRRVNERVTQGACLPQSDAGGTICGDGIFRYCASENGSPGDGESRPGLGGTAGTAGHNTHCLSSSYGPPDGPNGDHGKSGKAGLTGLAGKAGADRAGAFHLGAGALLEREAKITGGTGQRGMAGDGGGGGGAGGGRHGTFTFFTLSYSQCDIRIMQGGAGGPGGKGGCGGEGGKGGGTGGGSFGIVLKDANVQSNHLAILKSEGGRGGTGGDGGNGKAGAPGAEGKPGDHYSCRGYDYNAGKGGNGGDGMAGGSGGGGAGGNGGPSIALALIGSAKHDAQGLFHIEAGHGGTGGDGGKAAGKLHGDSGAAGLNEKTHHFEWIGRP